MVRKLGLEDIDWDPEQYCKHCIAKRAARGEAVAEVAPSSDSRPKLRVSLGWAKTPAVARSPKGWSKRRGKLTLVKLVRAARRERQDS
ncbi:hypothetical protein WMF31_32630 [Sorangium sp. So ce1036]|uniref:hypothetical protein n=1 Tax=Sorangium sp. So ce1036 TaxID=3133328 RepID=UPI003F0DCE52